MSTAAALKAKKGLEIEAQDLQQQLEAMTKSKQESDERCMQLSREKNELQSHVEDNDEEVSELLKKYKAAVQQV